MEQSSALPIESVEGEATMTTINPWKKAAECERFLRTAVDPQKQAILTNLRELWIALATERNWSTPNWDDEVEQIDDVHAHLTRLPH
jgi:hypothetical protein